MATPVVVVEVAAASPEEQEGVAAEVSEPAPEVAAERDSQVAAQNAAQDAANERVRQSYLAWVTFLRPAGGAGPGEQGFVGPLQASDFTFDDDTDESKDADKPVVAKFYVSPPAIS